MKGRAAPILTAPLWRTDRWSSPSPMDGPRCARGISSATWSGAAMYSACRARFP